jgi:hypothetical protein
VEDGASLDDLLRAALSSLFAGNASAAKHHINLIAMGAVVALERQARREDGLLLPAADWNLLVSLCIQIGDLGRAETLIKSQFSLPKFKLEIDPEVGDERFRFENRNNEIKIFLNPTCLNLTGWLIVYRTAEIFPMIEFLFKNVTRPIRVKFSVGDHGVGGELSFSSDSQNSVLVPDSYFVGRNAYENERRHFAARRIAWADRSTTVFWRGSTTGRRSAGWRSLPRIQLCQIAKDNPHLAMDFGINQVVQIDCVEEEADINAAGLTKPFVHSDNFDAYRYHIDIDGNSNSWPGLFIKLLSGGAVLKVDSQHGYRQWYYSQLVPWVHYIPIAADMSDLIEKVQWVTSHDDEACRIGQAGRGLALRMTLGSEARRMVDTVAAAIQSGVLT